MSSRDKKFLVIICALVVALVAVLVGVFVYFGNDGDNGNKPENSGNGIIISQNENSGNAGESENPEVPDKIGSDVLTEGAEIETPCGTVFYPGEWEEYLRTETVKENGGESIKFFADFEGKESVHLFDLNFGIAKGSRLGTVKTKTGTAELYFEVFEVIFDGSLSEDEENTIYSMQEAINNVFAQLDIDTNTSPAVEPSDGKVKIETPYGNINFPGEWEEYLYTEIDNTGDYTVKFYAEINGNRYRLFDIGFGEETDFSYGCFTAKDGSSVWLNVEVHDFVLEDDATSEETDVIYGMQEALNEIIEQFIG